MVVSYSSPCQRRCHAVFVHAVLGYADHKLSGLSPNPHAVLSHGMSRFKVKSHRAIWSMIDLIDVASLLYLELTVATWFCLASITTVLSSHAGRRMVLQLMDGDDSTCRSQASGCVDICAAVLAICNEVGVAAGPSHTHRNACFSSISTCLLPLIYVVTVVFVAAKSIGWRWWPVSR